MNENEQTPAGESSWQPVIGIASMACFASLIILNCVAGVAGEMIAVPWLKFSLFAIIPILVTFIILYRSDWHREMTGAARLVALFVLSCVILAGVLIFTGLALCFVTLIGKVFTGGFRPNHA